MIEACRWTGLLGAVLLLVGCASVQEHEKEIVVDPVTMRTFLEDKPQELQRLYVPVLTQGQRNAVLNHMRIGLAAMDLGLRDTAERSLDTALDGIEAIYADNPEAAQAREFFTKENIKDFKGEPYERVMTYYYRGLLYLMKGDYENARASFKGGMFQDMQTETEGVDPDFALMAFLEGWASQCNGDVGLAEEAFTEARRLGATMPGETDPELENLRIAIAQSTDQEQKAALSQAMRDMKTQKRADALASGFSRYEPPASDHDLLVVAESGAAPAKVATGEYDEKLTFARSDTDGVASVRVLQGQSKVTLPPSEDIYLQATTRGDRPVDFILDNKATFKSTTGTIGDVALHAGTAAAAYAGMSGDSDAAIAALAILAIGAMAKAAEAAATPDADVRSWDNLPDKVFVTTMKAEDSATVEVQYTDDSGQAIPGFGGPVEVIDGGKCKLAWTRTRSALDIPDRAPGSGVPADTE